MPLVGDTEVQLSIVIHECCLRHRPLAVCLLRNRLVEVVFYSFWIFLAGEGVGVVGGVVVRDEESYREGLFLFAVQNLEGLVNQGHDLFRKGVFYIL